MNILPHKCSDTTISLVMATATRVAGNEEGDGGKSNDDDTSTSLAMATTTRVAGGEECDSGKSDGNDEKGGGRAMAMAMAMRRAMAAATRAAGDKDGDGRWRGRRVVNQGFMLFARKISFWQSHVQNPKHTEPM